MSKSDVAGDEKRVGEANLREDRLLALADCLEGLFDCLELLNLEGLSDGEIPIEEIRARGVPVPRDVKRAVLMSFPNYKRTCCPVAYLLVNLRGGGVLAISELLALGNGFDGSYGTKRNRFYTPWCEEGSPEILKLITRDSVSPDLTKLGYSSFLDGQNDVVVN